MPSPDPARTDVAHVDGNARQWLIAVVALGWAGVSSGWHPPAVSLRRWLLAVAVSAAFAAVAWGLHGVSGSGALAGFAVSFALYLHAGAGGFLTLLGVFILTLLATRLGYARKRELGLAESGRGRDASQVLANLIVAAFAASLASQPGVSRALASAAAVAALAESAADTVSSEVGQAWSRTAYLLTTFRLVPAGTDGGVTFMGSLSGIAGAGLVALVAVATGWLPPSWLLIVIAAAVIGMFFDSLLGALLERRGWMNNDAVNLLGTASAALLGCWLA